MVVAQPKGPDRLERLLRRGRASPEQLTPTPRLLLRDLVVGAALGAVAGLPLAVCIAALGFPEWGVTTFSFAFIAAVIVLPLALALRGIAHGLNRVFEIGVRREHRTPTDRDQLVFMWPGNVVGAAAVVIYLCLLVVFVVGEGRVSPF